MLNKIKRHFLYIFTACVLAIAGGLIGLHMTNSGLYAQGVTNYSGECEDMGCGDDPECVELDGAYACQAEPGENTCYHTKCSDPGDDDPQG